MVSGRFRSRYKVARYRLVESFPCNLLSSSGSDGCGRLGSYAILTDPWSGFILRIKSSIMGDDLGGCETHRDGWEGVCITKKEEWNDTVPARAGVNC